MNHQLRWVAAMWLGAMVLPGALSAQGDTTSGRQLRFGSTRPTADTVRAIPDSILKDAIARFNQGGGSKIWGAATFAEGMSTARFAAYGGSIRFAGRTDGDLIVINGDVRIDATARIGGSLIVLGGHLTIEDGAQIGGSRTWFPEVAPVSLTSDNTLAVRTHTRTLAELAASNVSVQLGAVVASLDAGVGSYNRDEGLRLRISPRFSLVQDEHTSYRADFSGFVRTASDPTGNRPNLGWNGRLTMIRSTTVASLTAGIAARQVISPMADQAFSATESSLAALLFHEDYRDWYARRGWGLFADWRVAAHTTLHGSFDDDREQSTRAADPFSLFRNDEPWRPNPLVDDGRFRRMALGVEYDSRDDSMRATSGWWLRGTIRRTTSSDISPLSLPTSIRSAMPFDNFASQSIEIDARRYLQFGPSASLHMRVFARGWLSGDPQLIQDRVSMGGAEILPGYRFRDVNCDTRRTPDPAKPALCDRQAAIQVEYHHDLNLDLATRVGRFAIGLHHPTLVLSANTGSAWLAGDSAGRVPSNRLQSIAEWRSDVGIGIDNRWIGLYLSKSLADAEPVRLQLRLHPRFR